MISVLDNDLYKMSQSFAYFTLYPLAEGTFKFNDRNKECWSKKDGPDFMTLIKHELSQLQYVRLTEIEKRWCIEHIPYIPETYWEWLMTFRFEPEKINKLLGTDIDRQTMLDIFAREELSYDEASNEIIIPLLRRLC